jgi:hypothetical protein
VLLRITSWCPWRKKIFTVFKPYYTSTDFKIAVSSDQLTTLIGNTFIHRCSLSKFGVLVDPSSLGRPTSWCSSTTKGWKQWRKKIITVFRSHMFYQFHIVQINSRYTNVVCVWNTSMPGRVCPRESTSHHHYLTLHITMTTVCILTVERRCSLFHVFCW